MSDYSYRANDESLLTPVLYKYFVNPLVKVLPYRLPANLITLISFGFIISAFAIAVHGYRIQRYDFWWAIPIFAFLYIIGDCSDGKQARRTGTGSPLGEYFDHFLDSFVTGLLMGIFMISFRVTKPVIITISFFTLYTGQIGSFWERYKRRVMCFGKLSTSEGIILIALTSWLMSISPIRNALNTPLFFNITSGDILIIISMIGIGSSAIQSILRTHTISFRLVAHLILSFFVTCTAAYIYGNNMVYVTFVISFYNVFFLASLLAATNLASRECLPDIVIPLSFVLLFLLPNNAVLIQYMQIAYLAIRIGIKFTAFFKIHRQYWFWINPLPDKDNTTV